MKWNEWAREHIPDLNGKVIVVTGANTGIGFEAAKQFSLKGADTILACRNNTKAEEAIRSIRLEMPEARARYLYLDLGKLDSVKQFADNFKKLYTKLDVLVNNAGIILRPYSQTVDGFESHMGINHLGHFALTGHLFDLIMKTDGARIVNVSSLIYKKGKMDFENLMFDKGAGFSRIDAYSRSKLANLLFTCELARRLQKKKLSVKAVAVHPGFSYTDFGRRKISRVLKYSFYPAVRLITQSPAMGALPAVRAAVDQGVMSADFFGPGGKKERKGFPVKVRSNGACHNREDAARLWKISEELTGVKML